jgi:hypothetical protein
MDAVASTAHCEVVLVSGRISLRCIFCVFTWNGCNSDSSHEYCIIFYNYGFRELV